MAISLATATPDVVAAWFERRSYDCAQFAGGLEALARRKRELGLGVSAILPARDVASTIGPIVHEIHALNERAPLVDQLIVVDADSSDGSADVAAGAGAEVYGESELMPGFGPAIGKGDAMWRSLSVARGELIVYLDSDSTDFGAHFAYGLIGPLLTEPELRFVKGAYNRAWVGAGSAEPDGGGRVTELTARPLLNLFYPELTGFVQPLAGELAAPAGLLRSIPFLTGYAVEAAMLIDVLQHAGLDAMAQVDLGTRTNRTQPLLALSRMSYAVARGVESRLRREGRLRDAAHSDGRSPAAYVQAGRTVALDLHTCDVEVVERPPMAGLQ